MTLRNKFTSTIIPPNSGSSANQNIILLHDNANVRVRAFAFARPSSVA